MIPKPTRKEDRKLLDTYREKRCEICGDIMGVVAHHIKTKGSGGPDEEWNLLALCYVHHTEIHKRGAAYMIQNYFHVGRLLKKKGWMLNHLGKLTRILPINEN